jgi:hypothetical protein
MLWDFELEDAGEFARESRLSLPSTRLSCLVQPFGGSLAYLRNPFWSNEGASFDIRQTGPCQTFYELNFRRQRYYLLLILQSISRTNLCDPDSIAWVMLAFLARLDGWVNGRS